ncbi:glycosyltransferase, partial [Arthrobacter sp. H20]|uniref:glycosyltransferase n=1 Tax=Arthrobacter sp. H20 TaxID=1267981 RepID=UPI000687AA8D
MRYEDEVRSQSVGDSAKRAKYLADIDRFISEHEKLTLRRRRDASAIKSLEKELKVAQLSNSKLIQEAKILSEDNRKLRSTLAALRQSTRLRIGSAIVTPASAIAGLWPKPVKRTGQPQLARAADIPPVIVPAKSSNQSNRPIAGHSPGPLSLPAGPLDREEELRKRVLEQPSKANVYNLLSHQYFVLGRVAEPAKLIVAHSAVWTGLTAKERQLIDAVSGLDRLTRNPPDLPPSQSSPGYQVERGRILYCAHSVSPYNSNGYSTRTAGLVKGLAQAGANIVIAARPGYPWDIKTDIAPKSLSSYTEVINGIEHFFSHGPTWTQGPLDHFIQQAADSYVQIAIRNRVETIQAASNHVTALPALIAARRLGIPFVYEVRGLWEITESSTKAHWVQSDRFNFSKQMETLVAGNSDSVFAITPQVRDELVNRGVAPEKILILPNAVDTDEFSDMPQHLATRTKLGLDDGTPVIGYAGSLVEYEGLSTLLDAFKLLILKGIRVRMVVVGDGATLPKLKSQAEQLGIAEFISFTGRIPAEEIPAFISVFDIMPCPRMILPVTEMVSPIKPLEAMAAGKAVVLSDLAPLRELAGEDGERARLFPSGDPNGLADVLEDLLNDPAERQAMGRRARLWVVSERTWKRVGGIAWRSRGTTGAVSRSPRKLSELTLGIIADEFTRAGLQPDISLVEVHPDRWKAELESSSIDAMFVESAWDGNEGTWRGKVGYYDDESFADLLALLDHCREHSIPTIFWNKEDPVHFNRFKKTATHFDHVFTSDDESIPGYLQSGNPSVKSVASLPFYAQPRLHNPLPGAKAYSHTVSYAGSYYGDRYKKRSDQLHGLLAAALTPGLTIYDRQHLNPDSPYRFPPDLAPYVSGGLTYTEMLDAYKAHPVHVNVNSVEQSGTMFSRRVFEVAACGGAVISGPGRGIEHVFGSIIPIVQDQPGARDLITYWMENEHARNDDAWLAMRAVFRSHTAAHRLTYVLRTAGLHVAAPSLDKYALRVPEVTPEIIRVLEAQSVRPTLLLTDTKSGSPHPVDGIAIETMNPIDSRALLDAGITLIGDAPVAPIDRTFYEDLLTSRKYLAWESARIESGHTGERGQGL